MVIGIFGKTRISDERLGKAYLFDDLMQRDVFRIADQTEDDTDDVTHNPNEVKYLLNFCVSGQSLSTYQVSYLQGSGLKSFSFHLPQGSNIYPGPEPHLTTLI